MRDIIEVKKIPSGIKANLPMISSKDYKKNVCKDCCYFAGTTARAKRCLLKACVYQDDEERFAPALRELIDLKERDYLWAKVRLEETKENLDLVKSMFRDELREEARMQEECYRCPYHNNAPCVGICWKRLLSGRETI
ncbi:hypothetical protein CUS53_00265 [Enterococcus faecium]|uniref:hypothetical protein n=1 Tax=Enterococcus faecium TaxID=1352 RepID=UPI000CF32D7C|nr:hypothetical protein [Enterococcus faecium]PQG88511.1 hypothetical protein CUS53_00265 [Enterococcus faecium]